MSDPAEPATSPAMSVQMKLGLITVAGGIIVAIVQYVIGPLFVARQGRPSSPTVQANMSAAPPQTQSMTDSGAESANGDLGLARALPARAGDADPIDAGIIRAVCSRRLTSTDVELLNPYQLRVLRNAIFALHGYRFEDSQLKALFESQSWYRPADTSPLSALEEANVKVIERAERH